MKKTRSKKSRDTVPLNGRFYTIWLPDQINWPKEEKKNQQNQQQPLVSLCFELLYGLHDKHE
jgi:hypothetical protein